MGEQMQRAAGETGRGAGAIGKGSMILDGVGHGGIQRAGRKGPATGCCGTRPTDWVCPAPTTDVLSAVVVYDAVPLEATASDPVAEPVKFDSEPTSSGAGVLTLVVAVVLSSVTGAVSEPPTITVGVAPD